MRNKTSCFSLCMILCIPMLLWQRTFYVYQDHRLRVLTSFVPPVHNQGQLSSFTESCPMKNISVAIDSFFVLSITNLTAMFPEPVPFSGRFSGFFPYLPTFLPRLSSTSSIIARNSNPPAIRHCLFLVLAVMRLYLWPFDITISFLGAYSIPF